MAVAMDVILIRAVNDWLTANPQGSNPDRAKIKEHILNQTQLAVEAQNQICPKGMRLKVPDRLANAQIAEIIIQCERVACISCGKNEGAEDCELLGIYQESGDSKGIYDVSDKAMNNLIYAYNATVRKSDLDDIKMKLRDKLPVKTRCMDRDLIAVNNGIFDYKRKVLMPFDPNKIFLSKSKVDYNPAARNVVIHNPDDNTDWDVESWMAELSDDPEVVDLLWKILGAINRPGVHWDKSAWFYATSGNNGKGTLCQLMRNLCGKGSYASLALSDFAKDFQMEPLIGANAIITDENDVGVYLDKVANLKAVITNDVVLINRKHKQPVPYQFRGFMVQCLNEYPRIRDTSDSFYRRQLFVPFDKCFTGHARKYIKDDYLGRPEVLEYVMKKVLEMTYYELPEPESCKAVLEDYKEFNNPIQAFAEEIIPETKWGLLPFGFLYDLYKAWFAKNSPSGKVQGRNTFMKEIDDMAAAGKIPGFVSRGRKTDMRPGNLMNAPEPLILQYKLTDWMNPKYTGSDPNQICTTSVKKHYTGIVRAEYEKDVEMPPKVVPMDTATRQAMRDISGNKEISA